MSESWPIGADGDWRPSATATQTLVAVTVYFRRMAGARAARHSDGVSHAISHRLQLRLRPPAHQVHPKAVLWWALQSAIGWAALLVGGGVVLYFTDAPLWLVIVEVAVAVVAVAEMSITPRLQYRAHRWEVTDQAVYVQFGVLVREWRIAPLSRVQTVDSERGPLQQYLKLATVTVTTASASGPLKIRGLGQDEAAELVDRLTAITEATPGDAT
ncbi:PH domain-containing protein [Kibdelosporangium philippinense]|uniref:PH domain-containing protein n=1 Tax=Kibdelosporangium philippinense TaxID=211113 RepID=UPI00361E3631